MYLGTYFLNTWMDLIGEHDIQKAFLTIEERPFKALPKLIQAGYNSTAVIEGSDKRMSEFEACNVFDEKGINSEDFKTLVSDLASSLKVNNEQEKKPKPKAKKKK